MGQIRASSTRSQDRFDQSARVMPVGQHAQQLFTTSIDDGEQVIEIVSNGAGEAADGAHTGAGNGRLRARPA